MHSSDLRWKVAQQYQGPFGKIDERTVVVWMEMDSYGRVHHVTGDLTNAESVVDRFRKSLIAAQSDLFKQSRIRLDIGDIYVEGLPGGRNRMKIEWYAKILDGADEKAQDLIVEALGRGLDWK